MFRVLSLEKVNLFWVIVGPLRVGTYLFSMPVVKIISMHHKLAVTVCAEVFNNLSLKYSNKSSFAAI